VVPEVDSISGNTPGIRCIACTSEGARWKPESIQEDCKGDDEDVSGAGTVLVVSFEVEGAVDCCLTTICFFRDRPGGLFNILLLLINFLLGTGCVSRPSLILVRSWFSIREKLRMGDVIKSEVMKKLDDNKDSSAEFDAANSIFPVAPKEFEARPNKVVVRG